jgi:hypothetical protein
VSELTGFAVAPGGAMLAATWLRNQTTVVLLPIAAPA